MRVGKRPRYHPLGPWSANLGLRVPKSEALELLAFMSDHDLQVPGPEFESVEGCLNFKIWYDFLVDDEDSQSL